MVSVCPCDVICFICWCLSIPSVTDMRPRTRDSRGLHGRVVKERRALRTKLLGRPLLKSETDIDFPLVFDFTVCASNS